MTKDDIIRMANEANLPACHTTHPKALERFAKLIAEHELEEVAKEFNKMKAFGDTAQSFATFVRNMKK